MKKTKLTRSLLAACSIVALTAVMYGCVHSGDEPADDMTAMEPMEPVPVDVTMDVALGTVAQARLKAVLPDSGSSDTVTIPAGGTANRGSGLGVEFTCDSAYPCTVTVTNSLGTILASMTTQMLPDAAEPMVMAALPDPVDGFARLNDGNTSAIRPLVTTTTARDGTEEGNPAATELIGMGIGGPGVLDASMAGLRSIFDPNGGSFVDDAGDRLDAAAAATAGAPPALMGGSTITGADDGFDASMSDIASAPDGWVMKTLFRDWGDTAGDTGDGGYETGAIVVKNLGEGTEHPFDRALYLNYVNDAAKDMFQLTTLPDAPTTAPPASLATSVDINSDDNADNTAATRQWEEMVFDSDSLVGAQSQDPNIDANETFTGSYFGARGTFQCVAADNANCGLMVNDDGDVMVIDMNAVMPGIQGGGRWTFTPDPGETIMVPDQDWMAYGAWLTTPDDLGGTHRLGVFFNGLDVYEPHAMAFTVGDDNGLRGSATYSGGATGVYVDGADSGLFTARAMLTANFDVNSNGTADTGDYMISGRIDNFRSTDGVYLGDDTQASPNDPTAGENDWVVVLGMDALDPAVVADATAGDVMGITSGSADGVPWSGTWSGQLFGPGTDANGNAIPPSGVAGQFEANTGDPDGDGTAMTEADAVTAVIGAFGATKDE